jgi:hypothetical protein
MYVIYVVKVRGDAGVVLGGGPGTGSGPCPVTGTRRGADRVRAGGSDTG